MRVRIAAESSSGVTSHRQIMCEVDNTGSANFGIRLACSSDAQALAKLRYDFRASTATAVEDEKEFVKHCSSWMSDRLKEESCWRCWVAEHEQTLIGTLWLQLVEKIPNPNSEPEYHAYLTNFYLCENARGKQIGSRLLSTALAWCKGAGVHAVILWPTERSRSLYERYGFAVRPDLLALHIVDASVL